MRTLIVILIVACTACSKQKEVLATSAEKKTEPLAKKVIVDPAYERSTDAFQINSAEVVEHQLHVQVSYSGGCEGHVFELFTDGHLMKSLPPKQMFYLKHYANGDACKALIQETLYFDLTGTASEGNTLMILLQDHKGDLRMDF